MDRMMLSKFPKVFQYIGLGVASRTWYSDTYDMIKKVADDIDADPDVLVDLLCATSINADLKSNVAQAFRALYQLEWKEPFEGFLPVVIDKLELVRAGKELDSQKIAAFSRALKGDPNAVVVDLWMMRAFGLDKSYKMPNGNSRDRAPSKREFDQVTSDCLKIARHIGVEGRQIQSMVWAGIRTLNRGKETPVRYDDVLRKQAAKYKFLVAIRHETEDAENAFI